MKYRKSVGAKILLVGTILTLISILAYHIVPMITSLNENDNYFRTPVLLTYLNTISFFVFMIGFTYFAINDLKKDECNNVFNLALQNMVNMFLANSTNNFIEKIKNEKK